MKIIYFKTKNGKATFKYITQDDINRRLIDIGMIAGTLVTPLEVYADGTIDKAVQPVIDTIKSLAKPICYGSMLWGWSKIMLGQKSDGQKQLKNAIWGFIGVQFTPKVFDLLTKLGR